MERAFFLVHCNCIVNRVYAQDETEYELRCGVGSLDAPVGQDIRIGGDIPRPPRDLVAPALAPDPAVDNKVVFACLVHNSEGIPFTMRNINETGETEVSRFEVEKVVSLLK